MGGTNILGQHGRRRRLPKAVPRKAQKDERARPFSLRLPTFELSPSLPHYPHVMEDVLPFLTVRQASATYPVFAGRDLLDRAGSFVQARGQVFVITSPQLRAAFGEPVAGSFARVTILEMQEG